MQAGDYFMKKWLTYLFLLIAYLGYAQPSDWIDSTTSSVSTFFFPSSSLRLNGTTFKPAKGDAVAIFSKQLTGSYAGQYKCVGMRSFTAAAMDTFTLAAYKKIPGGSVYGFDSAQQAYILYWSATAKCYYELKISQNPIYLAPNTHVRLDSALLMRHNVVYPSPIYDKSISTDTPSVPMTLTSLTFSASPNGLYLNGVTGLIYPSASDTGYYTITLQTQGCLVSSTLQITIKSPTIPQTKTIDLSGLKCAKTDPSCTKPGTIVFDTDSIKGSPPFQYTLTNTSTQTSFINNTGHFEQLAEGVYQLQVADSLDSVATFPSSITLLRPNDCGNPVLAPDGKNGLETVYIQAQGSAKILDREGKVVKELTVPANWDGSDSNGKALPMGDYYLFVNGEQSQIITVIR